MHPVFNHASFIKQHIKTFFSNNTILAQYNFYFCVAFQYLDVTIVYLFKLLFLHFSFYTMFNFFVCLKHTILTKYLFTSLSTGYVPQMGLKR